VTFPFAGSTALPLGDEAYYLLNELLEERFGLHFPQHRRAILEARLQPRLKALGLEDFVEYYAALRANGNGEVKELAKAVTNNETYFFRERDQFDALFDHGTAVLGDTGRVLCAACSSGEEAYTLNFYARDLARGRVRPPAIDAFDLDLARLDIARRGECRERSLRHMTAEQVTRYLEPSAPERWVVRPPYREGVSFAHANLVDRTAFAAMPVYDVVFCRNVLIYFSREAMRRAVENLVSVLRPGGLLFLGHSESIIGMFPALETVRLGRCIVYRKVGS